MPISTRCVLRNRLYECALFFALNSLLSNAVMNFVCSCEISHKWSSIKMFGTHKTTLTYRNENIKWPTVHVFLLLLVELWEKIVIQHGWTESGFEKKSRSRLSLIQSGNLLPISYIHRWSITQPWWVLRSQRTLATRTNFPRDFSSKISKYWMPKDSNDERVEMWNKSLRLEEKHK